MSHMFASYVLIIDICIRFRISMLVKHKSMFNFPCGFISLQMNNVIAVAVV